MPVRWAVGQSLTVRPVIKSREARRPAAAACSNRYSLALVQQTTAPKKTASNINSSSMIVLQKCACSIYSNSRTGP